MKINKILIIIFMITLNYSSFGQSLTTLFSQNNMNEGITFDVVATNAITINSFDINLEDNGTVAVYYKLGTNVGFTNNPGAWTLLGSATVTSLGLNNPTPLPIGGLTIPAGQTYGFYMTSTTNHPDFGYTNGSGVGTVIASDANISILEGSGVDWNGGSLFGSINPGRRWNGTIYYSVSVPTLGQWGLIILSLLMMTFVMVFSMAPKMATANGQTIPTKVTLQNFAFDRNTFFAAWTGVALVIVLGFVTAMNVFGYELTSADPIGAFVASGIVAYMITKMKK